MWTISKEFRFEAAHQLPFHDGKCARLHGHSWRGVVYVSSDELVLSGAKSGMVVDFSEIKKALTPIVDGFLDHFFLNETTGIESPTSETIAKWIYDKLKPEIPQLIAIRIDETCTSSCLYAPAIEGSNRLTLASNAIDLG